MKAFTLWPSKIQQKFYDLQVWSDIPSPKHLSVFYRLSPFFAEDVLIIITFFETEELGKINTRCRWRNRRNFSSSRPTHKIIYFNNLNSLVDFLLIVISVNSLIKKIHYKNVKTTRPRRSTILQIISVTFLWSPSQQRGPQPADKTQTQLTPLCLQRHTRPALHRMTAWKLRTILLFLR